MSLSADQGRRSIPPLLRALMVVGLLYLFLVAISMLSGTFKGLGKDSAEAMIKGLSNPFASLAAGILATVLVQSSSVTTSFIVGAVIWNPETDDLATAIAPFVPMIMGANIGTTITNTLAAIGHVHRKEEFRRAFAGATMHDFFNVLCVAIMLPLEILTGALTKSAVWLVGMLNLDQGLEYKSPVKTAVKAGYTTVKDIVSSGLSADEVPFIVVMLVLALGLIFFCLVFITKNMKVLMANKLEVTINRALEKSGLLGIVVGILVTVSVQSSSITTSIMVPMFGAGLLTLHNGFPLMLGANIGTTVTALLAAVVKGPAGLTLAAVHLLFNLGGVLLFFPFPAMRRIPIRMAERLASLTLQSRLWILGYIGTFFVAIPLLGILLFD